ncbi:DUF3311 domain-containing protein [Acrocarpospora catenulata]|uniref:DUF3311 domain-containing protein n=1 Tax=Acrocarpospora catenulata TaxID=2836182 RepID=UPI001BDA5F87|nr:DUF3311 domain-containing protein [Acrocarpospora catenulata]
MAGPPYPSLPLHSGAEPIRPTRIQPPQTRPPQTQPPQTQPIRPVPLSRNALPGEPEAGSGPRPGQGARLLATILLGTPFLLLLWVGGYARTGPSLFGIPFFYWYQLLWVFISACVTGCAYRLLTPRRRTPRDLW